MKLIINQRFDHYSISLFKIGLLIIFTLSLLPLSNLNAQQKTLSIDVNKSTSQTISEIFDVRMVIPLETNRNCLIKHIYSMKIKDDSIYILSGNKLLLFSSAGKFITQINKIGKGPEEMLLATDFDFCKNEIVILDNGSSSLVYYTSKGKFIRRQKFNLSFITNFDVLPQGNFIFYSHHNPQGNERYNVYILNNQLKVVAKQLAFNQALEWLQVLDFNQLSTFSGQPFIHLSFDKNVYNIRDKALVPYIKIDLMKNEIPEEFFTKFNSSNYIDFHKTIQKYKYAEITNFQEFQKQYFTTLNYSGTSWTYIISKTSGRHKVYKPDRFDFLSCLQPRFAHNGNVIAIVEPDELKEKLKLTLPSIRSQRKESFNYWNNIAQSLDESDNPLIVFLQIKDF